MSENDDSGNGRNKVPKPPGWRDDIVVVEMGKPIPKSDGALAVLQFMRKRDH